MSYYRGRMKSLLIILFLLGAGCTTSVTTPAGFKYTGYIKEEGIGAVVEPPFWKWAVGLYEKWTAK